MVSKSENAAIRRGGNESPLGIVPEPKLIRDRLAENMREARVLRSLLRLSQRARAIQTPIREVAADA